MAAVVVGDVEGLAAAVADSLAYDPAVRLVLVPLLPGVHSLKVLGIARVGGDRALDGGVVAGSNAEIVDGAGRLSSRAGVVHPNDRCPVEARRDLDVFIDVVLPLALEVELRSAVNGDPSFGQTVGAEV